jgi:plastocyanin domain-containing protein
MRKDYTTFVAVGLLLLAGCQSTGEPPPRVAYTAKADPDGVQRVRVMAGNYFFKPNHIIVKANVPVELLASREAGMVPHDLVIDEAGVKQELSTEPARISFTPRKAGRYVIYCSKKPPVMASHRERGMEGVLEVVP